MSLLDKKFIHQLLQTNGQKDLFKGHFGLEKENIRVNHEGKLALTPHPKAFGNKNENPYIQTDFSESQIEMITPVFDSIDETYNFLENLQNMVTLELEDEYLWPSSNPPALPEDEEIPIAILDDPMEEYYRLQLAGKYGRKKQVLSGIHYNFSFHENIITELYRSENGTRSFREFKDDLYLKVARNVLNYRWLLIYLTGASPVFSKTYLQECVQKSQSLDGESHFFPNMNSLRNSVCGYRNHKPYYVSLDSLGEYLHDLQELIRSNELLNVKEFYSPVRVKATGGKDQVQALLERGISYLELRMIDLNPLDKNGINKDTMTFIHLFLIYMLLIRDEPFQEEEQRVAALSQDTLAQEGIMGTVTLPTGDSYSLQDQGLQLLEEMMEMVQLLAPANEPYRRLLEEKKHVLLNPDQCFASQVRAEIQQSSYLTYHMEKAKQYAQESRNSGYQLIGYEDLELSTQLLLKAAVKRGIQFEIVDRADNFVLLKKGPYTEYVKQATKTSLDSYVSVLIMENKIVTKKVLREHGIRVPTGAVYHELPQAMADFELYQKKAIVIKPKSTNFGLGITIFNQPFSKEDYQQAFEMAFKHDQTVLLEEFMTGKEYRFLVMGDEVVGILHRVPANVTGDGLHTIEELVADKNKDPLRGQGYKTPLEYIRLGEVEKMFLKNQGKSVTDIPSKGERVFLRENSNISTGGDSIDYTDDIPESYKQLAVQAAKAADATFCGIDMVIDDITEEAADSNYGIIEINFNPAIHIHCYPYQGKNRKADEKILDLLFS